MKIRPLGAELSHADGQADGRRTDMTKSIVVFRNFTKKVLKLSCVRSVSQPRNRKQCGARVLDILHDTRGTASDIVIPRRRINLASRTTATTQ